jgi:hypothetical protein
MSNESQSTPTTAEGSSGTRTSMTDFVTAWQTSGSVQEIADKLGIKSTSAGQRACQYRSQGIKLKKMPRGGGARLNVDQANELIAQLSGEQENEGSEGSTDS